MYSMRGCDSVRAVRRSCTVWPSCHSCLRSTPPNRILSDTLHRCLDGYHTHRGHSDTLKRNTHTDPPCDHFRLATKVTIVEQCHTISFLLRVLSSCCNRITPGPQRRRECGHCRMSILKVSKVQMFGRMAPLSVNLWSQGSFSFWAQECLPGPSVDYFNPTPCYQVVPP